MTFHLNYVSIINITRTDRPVRYLISLISVFFLSFLFCGAVNTNGPNSLAIELTHLKPSISRFFLLKTNIYRLHF